MRDWPAGIIPRYHRAVFLDRDGTINVDTHFSHAIDDLKFIPMAKNAMALLATLPVDIIVVSNQAGIALGMFTQSEMSRFNTELKARVEAFGGRIDAFYFCPHLEPKHLPPGALLCQCSKPSPGMLSEAAKDFALDLTRSFVIGDKTSDIAAGASVGCTTILVETGKAGREDESLPVTPDYRTKNLYQASLLVQQLLKREVAA